jgi:hypothetical protein
MQFTFLLSGTFPSPPPRALGGGGGYWLFLSPSRGFGYGFEAVRISVKLLLARFKWSVAVLLGYLQYDTSHAGPNTDTHLE